MLVSTCMILGCLFLLLDSGAGWIYVIAAGSALAALSLPGVRSGCGAESRGGALFRDAVNLIPIGMNELLEEKDNCDTASTKQFSMARNETPVFFHAVQQEVAPAILEH